MERNAAPRAELITLCREALASLAEMSESLPKGGEPRREALELVLRVCNVGMDELRTILRNEGDTQIEALKGTMVRKGY